MPYPNQFPYSVYPQTIQPMYNDPVPYNPSSIQFQQTQNPTPTPNPNQNYYRIAGKFVNNINEVLPQDVPMDGSRSVFPTQDGSKIFVKHWNPDGTIGTDVYEKAQPAPVMYDSYDDSKWEELYSNIHSLEDRIKKLESSSNRSRPGQGYGDKSRKREEANNDS